MSHEDVIAQKLAENFEKLRSSLDNLRSMLEDLALAVPALPDTRRLAEAIAAELPEPEQPKAAPEAPLPAPAPLTNVLLYRMAAIEYAKTQSEILDQLLLSLQDFAQRGVFFIVREDVAQAWNAFGFGGDMKQLKVKVNDDPILRTVVGSRSRMLLDNTVPAFIPAGGAVQRSLISPLLLKGKVSAFLYADSGEGGKLDHYSLDILLRTASLVIDIFPLRPKREPLAPVLENQNIILPGVAPAPETAETGGELFEDSGTLAAVEADELPANQTIAARIPPEVMAYNQKPAPVEPEPVEPPEAEVIEEAQVVEEIAPEAETEAEAEAAPPPAEEPIPPGEEKLHEDAQRFARLLIQEIALYHPKEVEQGRRDSNLYSLLKDDVDRSREAYDHRFQKPSVQSRRYFEKALVQYLAGGDDTLLGM